LPLDFTSAVTLRGKSRKVSRVTRFPAISTPSRFPPCRTATRYKIKFQSILILLDIPYSVRSRRGVFNDFAQENCSYRHPECGLLAPHAEFLQCSFTILPDSDAKFRFLDFYARKSLNVRP
jgi:hypothetical protein